MKATSPPDFPKSFTTFKKLRKNQTNRDNKCKKSLWLCFLYVLFSYQLRTENSSSIVCPRFCHPVPAHTPSLPRPPPPTPTPICAPPKDGGGHLQPPERIKNKKNKDRLNDHFFEFVFPNPRVMCWPLGSRCGISLFQKTVLIRSVRYAETAYEIAL